MAEVTWIRRGGGSGKGGHCSEGDSGWDGSTVFSDGYVVVAATEVVATATAAAVAAAMAAATAVAMAAAMAVAMAGGR